MKTAIDMADGRIVGYDERTNELLIRARYDDYFTLVKRNYKRCRIRLIDSRRISDKQRRACYALLNAIAEYTGEDLESVKDFQKFMFRKQQYENTGEEIENFSLSDAPMSLIVEFQRLLVRFIIDWDIPTSFPLLDMVDDVDDYLYACLIQKKCCICGKRGDLHHMDAVGMGRDREEIVHAGMRVLPLCREHHTEIHTLGKHSFVDKYHLTGGIELDRTLCKIYGLKSRRKGGANAESHHDHGTSHTGP